MPGSPSADECNTGLSWPENVYSLAHVALPFRPDDPSYGGDDAGPGPGIALGQMALRGERNVLQVTAAEMLRLRYNPFHAYMEQRLLAFMGLAPNLDIPCFAHLKTTAEPG
jgi:hypothetical protein